MYTKMNGILFINILLAVTVRFVCEATDYTAWTPICEDTGWEKVPGMKPEHIASNKTLYAGVDSEGIVVICFNRCSTANCTAFVIDFDTSACYSVETGSNDFVPEPKATFYHKICLKVPPSCRTRMWQVERTLGAILIDSDSNLVSEIVTRSQCYQRCLAAGTKCQAAQFRTSRDLAIDDSPGQCALLSVSRSMKPQSYRASMYRDEYLENQCHNLSNTEYCSYAEYRNQTMPYSDLKVSDHGAMQCEQRCNNANDGFVCRSYTVDISEPEKTTCFLHSDDTIGAGVSSLVKKSNVIYREREPCINLKVQCSNTSFTVELNTKEPFTGRMYTLGYSETCSVEGSGHNTTILVLSLPEKEDLDAGNIACGIIPIYAVDNENRTRTAISVTVVIQYNPIVQRLGDQSVKVGCTLDDPEVPGPIDVVVNAGYEFTDPNPENLENIHLGSTPILQNTTGSVLNWVGHNSTRAILNFAGPSRIKTIIQLDTRHIRCLCAGIPTQTWTVFNTTAVPIVTMKILDKDNNDVVVTNLGDKLTLRIDISPADGPYDIFAGHMVASSASRASSILLLDEMGCPSNPQTFPAMTRDPTNNRSLVATFGAFKFPDSLQVRFNVVVKFCLTECEAVKCGHGIISYGRKRRSTSEATPSTNISDVSELTVTDGKIDELPLQRVIIVQDSVITADRLRSGKAADTILIAGEKSLDGLLCVDAALVLGLLLFWLCVQIVLTFGCIFLVRRYRRHARKAAEDRADILARHLYGIHGGNFEIARRVRWADHNGSSVS